MTTPTPSPADPSGPNVMEPPPGTHTDGSQQLLDAGALEADGTERDQVAQAAAEGDARLRAAEEAADGGATQGDALAPTTATAPYTQSSGRGEGAGHAQGGTTSSGR